MQKQDTTFSKTEIAARRQKVGEKYLKGMPQTLIAVELGVNQATVSRDLAELRKEWLDRSINHIDQKKGIELAKLDQLELTYWSAWERSKENAETTIERHTPSLGDSFETKSVGQAGDPRFLDGVLKCIDKRCQILGLDAPKKIGLSDGEGGPVVIRIKGVKPHEDI